MKPTRGYRHFHDDDALRRYRALSPEQKLRWLYSAWRLTRDFLPKEKLAGWQKMRRGEI